MLKAEQIAKRYGTKWVFRGVSFELEQAECLVVTGINGSGKSTLLRLVAGLDSCTEGKIHLPAGDRRHILGFSALDQSVYAELTCQEHLELTGRLRGCPPRANELLEQVGLNLASDLRAKELSTGMRSRLRVAMAIQAKPLILLLDEPGASLDEAGKSVVKQVVADQLGRGCVLLATNDPDELTFATHQLEVSRPS